MISSFSLAHSTGRSAFRLPVAIEPGHWTTTRAFGSSDPYTKYSTIRPSDCWMNLPPSPVILATLIGPGALPQHAWSNVAHEVQA